MLNRLRSDRGAIDAPGLLLAIAGGILITVGVSFLAFMTTDAWQKAAHPDGKPTYARVCVDPKKDVRVRDNACADDSTGAVQWRYFPSKDDAGYVGESAAGATTTIPDGSKVEGVPERQDSHRSGGTFIYHMGNGSYWVSP